MSYYHVRIKKINSKHWIFSLDLSKDRLETDIISHIQKQESFICDNVLIRFSEIDTFGINETDIQSNEILKKTRAKRIFNKLFSSNTGRSSYLMDMQEVVSYGKDVTREFIQYWNTPEVSSPKLDLPIVDKRSSNGRDKVFIVHGRDDRQALYLQKFLKDKLKVNAILFDDLPDKGKTIIEQIEYIQKNIFHAFVIVTPDDVGCLSQEFDKIKPLIEGLKTITNEEMTKIFALLHGRARQNVVFELGLFIGALGREHVCCLKQKSVTERPSDIDGILYKEFDVDVKEIFHELSDEIFTKA
jgi:predicted nucleotide-binding protein